MREPQGPGFVQTVLGAASQPVEQVQPLAGSMIESVVGEDDMASFGREPTSERWIREQARNLALELAFVRVGVNQVTENFCQPRYIVRQHHPSGGQDVKKAVCKEAVGAHRSMVIRYDDVSRPIGRCQVVIRICSHCAQTLPLGSHPSVARRDQMAGHYASASEGPGDWASEHCRHRALMFRTVRLWGRS